MAETDLDKTLDRWRATLAGAFSGADPDATVRRPSIDAREPSAPPPSPPPTTTKSGTLPPSAAAPLEGTASTFQLFEVLGQGGMGIVYRGVQPGLDREVAVKRALGGAGPARAQFLAEARITGQLDHPNIIPVYELVTTPGGECALAMKRVRGTSWKELIHPPEGQAPRDLEFHLGVLLSVANAVGFAHSRHVVHADLKPENVMVGEFGEVLVMDWGIAVDCAEPPTPGSPIPHRSRLLGVCGSPSYIPPEMALGDGSRIGPWTDTYLLGSILYEVISGAPPHRRPSLFDTLRSAASGEIVPLPEGTEEGLRKLVMRALSVEPPQRFADATQFRDALSAYVRSRESLVLSAQARGLFERARGPVAGAEHARDYLQLAEAGAGFRQALVLWPENEEARRGAEEASATLAERALANGDLGLAGSELGRLEGTPQAARLSGALATARAQRAKAERVARAARQTIVGLTVLVIGILGGGLWLVRGAERVAEARLRTVHRLADVKHLADYRAEAEELWPAREDKVPDLERWLARAHDLLNGLDQHRATLADLRATALALPDGGYQLGSDSDQWQHDTLVGLIAGLEDFAAHDVPAMERRLEFARTVSTRSIADHLAEWTRATDAIANPEVSPLYRGLHLPPQVGLIPLGPDPKSGLWEFAHLESGQAPARGADGRLAIDGDSGVVLVLVPPGRFAMGVEKPSPEHPLGTANVDPQARSEEGPVHDVQLGAFFLSKYEMTQGQWLRATGVNPSAYQAGQVIGGKTLTLQNPVEQVTWADCKRVLGHWALTLPTEAQWEYAARGGTHTVYWEGDHVEDLQGAANLADRYCRDHGGPASWVYEPSLDDGWVTHAPVGLLRANPFGLHDMQGNVWEWCQDRYGPYTLPVAPGTGERLVSGDGPRVFRGGGFRSSGVHARSGDRYSLYYGGSKAFDVGVRPARVIDP